MHAQAQIEGQAWGNRLISVWRMVGEEGISEGRTAR
jgi:hypothetical protein